MSPLEIDLTNAEAQHRADVDAMKILGKKIEDGIPTHKALETIKENEKQIADLRRTVAFFASVIKSGEGWSDACEKEFKKVMP